jgi:hypothetical protein
MVRVGVGVGVNGGLLCIRAVLVGGCNAMSPGAHVHCEKWCEFDLAPHAGYEA